MQVFPINSSRCFQGKFEVNPLLNKFREESIPSQKDIFEKVIQKVEKEPDGRLFKFDKIANPKCAGGAEVGIFEHKALINDTYWIPLFCSTREKAAWCFDQLNNLYKI